MRLLLLVLMAIPYGWAWHRVYLLYAFNAVSPIDPKVLATSISDVGYVFLSGAFFAVALVLALWRWAARDEPNRKSAHFGLIAVAAVFGVAPVSLMIAEAFQVR